SPGVAFHGFTRTSALALTGGIPPNKFDNVATDIPWMAAVALSGELHRVENVIYRKRFHGTNVLGRVAKWKRGKRLQEWGAHCVNMIEQALRVAGTAHELRLLWLAAVTRLAAPSLTGYLFNALHLTRRERFTLIDSFLADARKSTVHDIPVLLDMEWPEIEAVSRAFYWLPGRQMVEIVKFGPEPVRRGQAFGVQPDGSSAIWVRTSRTREP